MGYFIKFNKKIFGFIFLEFFTFSIICAMNNSENENQNFERRKKISNIGKIVKNSRLKESIDIDEIENRKKTFYKTDKQDLNKTWPEYGNEFSLSDDEECPEECKNFLDMFNKIKEDMNKELENKDSENQ